MRESIIATLCCFLVSFSAIAATPVLQGAGGVKLASFTGVSGIDPIVTGVSVSHDQFSRWQKARMRFDRCGLCGDIQAYPGE